MAQVSVKDQVKKLVELQAIDAEIYRFKKSLEEKPVFIEELKQKFEGQKASLKTLEDRLKTLQLNHKTQEIELQSKEGDITKTNAQLSQLKTNKEYQAKLTEIEGIKADMSIVEEKILLMYDEIDAAKAAIAKEKNVLAEEEKKFLSQKKEIEESIREIEEKVKILDMKRHQILPEVDKGSLSRYERILQNKKGLAIVPVKGNSCGGCFMNVPDQVINDIKMHDRLILCEMCARILYLEDDL